MVNIMSNKNFEACTRNALTIAARQALGLAEDAKLRKHLIITYLPENVRKRDGEDADTTSELCQFAQQLKDGTVNLRGTEHCIRLAEILDLDDTQMAKKAVRPEKKAKGLTRMQKAVYGLLKQAAMGDAVGVAAAYETALVCNLKNIAGILTTGETLKGKQDEVGALVDEVCGLAGIQYKDTEGVEKYLLGLYPSYASDIAGAFEWHTAKAWSTARYNIDQYLQSSQRQAA